MKVHTALRFSLALTAVASAGFCVAGPDTEPWGPAQTAADYIRSAARSDIAFLPAGVLKPAFKAGDLSGLLLFPTDDVSVVELTGATIKQALERSIALYPSPNPGFLQVSGLVVTFSKGADASKRILSATIAGADLDLARKYRVAMPGSLARGGLGYFTIWDKDQKVENLPNQNLESVLKGKSGTDPQPRWKAVD